MTHNDTETLQKELERTRESIANTVTEIQSTMVTEYEQVKSNVNDMLDWRLQVREHPIGFMAGALILGLLVGRKVGGQLSQHDLGEMTHDVTSTVGQHTSGMMHSARNSHLFQQIGAGVSRVIDELVEELVKTGRETVVPSVVASVMDKVGADGQDYRRSHGL